jgi:hypothetical protein
VKTKPVNAFWISRGMVIRLPVGQALYHEVRDNHAGDKHVIVCDDCEIHVDPEDTLYVLTADIDIGQSLPRVTVE